MYGNNDYRDYLAHYGVLGMKWGRRKQKPTSGNVRSSKQIKSYNGKDAVRNMQTSSQNTGLSRNQKIAIGVGVVASVVGTAIMARKITDINVKKVWDSIPHGEDKALIRWGARLKNQGSRYTGEKLEFLNEAAKKGYGKQNIVTRVGSKVADNARYKQYVANEKKQIKKEVAAQLKKDQDAYIQRTLVNKIEVNRTPVARSEVSRTPINRVSTTSTAVNKAVSDVDKTTQDLIKQNEELMQKIKKMQGMR